LSASPILSNIGAGNTSGSRVRVAFVALFRAFDDAVAAVVARLTRSRAGEVPFDRAGARTTIVVGRIVVIALFDERRTGQSDQTIPTNVATAAKLAREHVTDVTRSDAAIVLAAVRSGDVPIVAVLARFLDAVTAQVAGDAFSGARPGSFDLAHGRTTVAVVVVPIVAVFVPLDLSVATQHAITAGPPLGALADGEGFDLAGGAATVAAHLVAVVTLLVNEVGEGTIDDAVATTDAGLTRNWARPGRGIRILEFAVGVAAVHRGAVSVVALFVTAGTGG
jgi:hypothetical protein